MRCHPLGLSALLSFCILLAPLSVDAADKSKAGADEADLIRQLTKPAPKKPVRLTPAQIAAQKLNRQRVEIQALFVTFKKPYEAGRRPGIAKRLLKYGPQTAGKLVRHIAGEFQGKYQSYLNDLQKAAAGSKRNGGSAAEVNSLRQTVLALSDGRTPTKDQIVLKADPAMARLKELLTVSSTSVRSSDQRLKLKRRRQELLELVTIWAQAFEVWASANQDAVNGAGASGKGAAGPKGNGSRTSKITASNQPPDKAQFEQELGFLEEFAAHLATPMPATDKQTLIANFRLRSKIDEAEAAGVLKLNLMRIQLGLNAVSIDLKLTQAARGHSKDMQTKKFFSHTSPLPGKSRFTDRAKLSGTTANAENIYMGRTSPDAAIMAWWHSPGHHVNMMGPYKRIGLGRYDRHWTQMFGR